LGLSGVFCRLARVAGASGALGAFFVPEAPLNWATYLSLGAPASGRLLLGDVFVLGFLARQACLI